MISYGCMNYFMRKVIIGFVIAYVVLYILSPQFANFLLALFLILFIPGLIIRFFIMDSLYKKSIFIVSKQFIFNNYTLTNDFCTVKYTPDEKLVVLDNIQSNKNREQRTFTISKSKKLNINKCWNKVCRIFDKYASLDSLKAFFSYDTHIELVTIPSASPKKSKTVSSESVNKSESQQNQKFVEMKNVAPDSFGVNPEDSKNKAEKFVNMNNLNEMNKPVEKQKEAPKFVDMEQILSLSSNKIDVNTATAAELALLPGINIAIAKRIVEVRDTSGFFKSEEEFFKTANLKEYFVEKIKTMIKIEDPSLKKKDGGDDDDGRVVDL